MVEQLLQRLKDGDISGLAGTNLALELPISGQLFQQLMDARPAGGPIQRLNFRFLDGNRAIIDLAADAPVVGTINRELALVLHGEYDRQQGGLIYFDIVDGLKLFDKPVINLLQGAVEKKLPAGIELNSKRISIDFPRLLTDLGHGYLLGLIAGAKMETRADRLVLFLHFQA